MDLVYLRTQTYNPVPFEGLFGVRSMLFRYDDLKEWALDDDWGGSGKRPPLSLTIATLLCYDMVSKEKQMAIARDPHGASPGAQLLAEMRGKALKGVVLGIANHFVQAFNTLVRELDQKTLERDREPLQRAYERIFTRSWDESLSLDPDEFADLPHVGVKRLLAKMQGRVKVCLRRKPGKGEGIANLLQDQVFRDPLPYVEAQKPPPNRDEFNWARGRLQRAVGELERTFSEFLYFTGAELLKDQPEIFQYRNRGVNIMKKKRDWRLAALHAREYSGEDPLVFDYAYEIAIVYQDIFTELGEPPKVENLRFDRGTSAKGITNYQTFLAALKEGTEALEAYIAARDRLVGTAKMDDTERWEKNGKRKREIYERTDKAYIEQLPAHFYVDAFSDGLLVASTDPFSSLGEISMAWSLKFAQRPLEHKIVELFTRLIHEQDARWRAVFPDLGDRGHDDVHARLGCGEPPPPKKEVVVVEKKKKKPEPPKTQWVIYYVDGKIQVTNPPLDLTLAYHKMEERMSVAARPDLKKNLEERQALYLRLERDYQTAREAGDNDEKIAENLRTSEIRKIATDKTEQSKQIKEFYTIAIDEPHRQ